MSAITLQFDTAADLESALLDALQNNEGHVSGIAAYLAQTGGEAVAPEAKPEWPNGAFFTDGDGSFYDEQAEPLPGKESRHMDESELYCPQCNGSGEGREMTTGHGPDDYEYDCQCQLCGGDGSLLNAFKGMEADRDNFRQKYYAALRSRSGVSADPLPRPLLTDLEIQGLRRQARNDPRCADQHWFILMVRAIESYYGVTGAAAQSQPLVEPTAARVSFLLEQKSALPHWENLMAYQSEDSARKALPVFRKTTSRDIRIVRQTREVVAVDSVAASPPQHQVKKGEPS